MRTAYVALIFLQTVWHALLPAPAGAGKWWLALVATLPLLLPLKGLLEKSYRSQTWAGYLVLLYLVIGIMEAWSNPPQRIPALIQVGLVVVFIGCYLQFSRESRRAQ
jgi:uncharacterized membrane protein